MRENVRDLVSLKHPGARNSGIGPLLHVPQQFRTRQAAILRPFVAQGKPRRCNL